MDLQHVSSVIPNAIGALILPLEVILIFWEGAFNSPSLKTDRKKAFKKNEQGNLAGPRTFT